MNAILPVESNVELQLHQLATSGRHSGHEVEDELLSEIRLLGGEAKAKATEEALAAFYNAVADLVANDPRKYGADGDAESQRKVVRELTASVRVGFLRRTVEELRREAGYIRVTGLWLHRAIFTFVAFGLLIAGLVPVCAVSLLSDSQWGWIPGVAGIAIAVIAGVWILSRVRSR